MQIVLAVLSIFGITILIWFLNRVSSIKICPICAGVSGTWFWMLLANFLGYSIDKVILALLLGGSVVGIAYQAEKKLPAGRLPLLWKTLFITTGFFAAYSLILFWWVVSLFSLIALLLLVFYFFRPLISHPPKTDKTVKSLEKKMEECC